MTANHDYVVKIVLIGDSCVGKSHIIKRFVDNEYDSTLPSTMSIDFSIRTLHVGNSKVKLQLWDTSGNERATNITGAYFRGAHAIMISYTITDKSTFNRVAYWLRLINQNGSENVIKILVGNQADMVEERQVTLETAQQFANDNNVYFMEVSAKTGMNVEDAFTFVVKQLIKTHLRNQERLQQEIFNVLEANKFHVEEQEFDKWKSEFVNMKYTESMLLSDVVDGYIGEYNKNMLSEMLKTKLKYTHKKRQRFYYILLTKFTKLKQMNQKNVIKLLKVIAFNLDGDVDFDVIEQIVRQKQLNGNVLVTEYMGLRGSNKFVKIFATNNYDEYVWNEIFIRLCEWNLFVNPIPIPVQHIQHGQIHYDDIHDILEEELDMKEEEFNTLKSQLKAEHYTQNMLLHDLVNGYIGEYKQDKKSLTNILQKILKYSANKRSKFYFTLLKKLTKPQEFDNDNFVKILKLIAFNLYPKIDNNKMAQVGIEQNLNGYLLVHGSTQFKKFGNSNKFEKLFTSVTSYDTKLIFDRLSKWNLIENPVPMPGSVQDSKLLITKTFHKFINHQLSKHQMIEAIDEKLDIQYKPLHRFDSNDIQNTILKYILNDTKFNKCLSKTKQILLTKRLSGDKIVSMGMDNFKLLLQNDFFAFMTHETFNIMIDDLKIEINENPNIHSMNSSQIAHLVHYAPLNKLIQRINDITDVIDGVKFIEYYKQQNEWIKNVTGWHEQEIYQIQAVLFRHNVCSDLVIKQKMKTIFDTYFGQLLSENVLQKIMSKFDIEEVVLKMIRNKNIEPFSDFVINMIDYLQNNAESNAKINEFTQLTYQIFAECFQFNYTALIQNQKLSLTKYDLLHPTWICRNCSNENVANYVDSKIHYDLSICSLCGITQKDSIILQLRNI
eukprot:116299_1